MSKRFFHIVTSSVISSAPKTHIYIIDAERYKSLTEQLPDIMSFPHHPRYASFGSMADAVTHLDSLPGLTASQHYAHSNWAVLCYSCAPVDRAPLGLRPRYVVLEERKQEIRAAMLRYVEANYPIPLEWTAELNEVMKELHKTGQT